MNPDFQYQPQPQQPQQPMAGPVPGQAPTPMQGQYPMPGAPQPAPVPGFSPVPSGNLPPVRRSNPLKKWLILTFVFLFTTLLATGVAVWAYINYLDQKDNTDSKISVAVAQKVKETEDKAAAAFLEKEKQPNRQFVGPDDYGRLSFDYPKTWSVYEGRDASAGGSYEVYLNPGVVPVVNLKQQYALRVMIEEKDYDKVIDTYKSLVGKGELKSSSVTLNEQNGTRLEGNFSKDIRGFAVIFKIRDKTVTIRSDAETFRADFDALIKTVDFNK